MVPLRRSGHEAGRRLRPRPRARRTVAGKGEVTGEDQRPKTPAERLGLAGPKRAKAEKCLANAVYFKSRSEPVRGQIAVAQVVMNRAFSGFYPNDVCGVVYQNAHRHLSCQFTFACDGIPDVVNRSEVMGARQAHRARDARRQAVAAGDRQGDALPRVLCQPVLGARDAEARQDRPASFLSSAQMGRRRGRAVLGQRDLHGGCGREDVRCYCSPQGAKRNADSRNRDLERCRFPSSSPGPVRGWRRRGAPAG